MNAVKEVFEKLQQKCPKLQIKRIVEYGQEIPRFYGLAYKEELSFRYVCYPLLINQVVYFWHHFIRAIKGVPLP